MKNLILACMAGVLLGGCSPGSSAPEESPGPATAMESPVSPAASPSAVQSAEPSIPVEVEVDQEDNPLNMDGEKPWYPPFLTYIHIRALEDSVKVTDAKINRGNCTVSMWFSHNSPLRFGDEIRGQLNCEQDNVREVTVTTDKGTYTFNF